MSQDVPVTRFNNPPFMYHAGMWAERTASADCSRDHVLLLLAKRQFTKLDRLILYSLGQYGYLNVYLIRRYAAMNGFRSANPSLIKERLSFLLKNGLLFRYEFFHTDPQTYAVNGSPFVYALSGGGWMFLKMSYKMHLLAKGIRGFYEFPDLKDQSRIAQILCLLSENQFAILFEDQYAGRIDMQADIKGVHSPHNAHRLEYRIHFPDGRKTMIFPVSIRQYADWETICLRRLSDLSAYCKKQKVTSFSTLMICETSEHALVCEKLKQSHPEFADMDVFYGLDHTIAGCPDALGRMLEVQRNGEYMTRNYFRLDLCCDTKPDTPKKKTKNSGKN